MTQFTFCVPGQGSQAVGMLADMAATWPVIEETFGEASAALGYDLWALAQQGPAEELNKTWQTQPGAADRLRGAIPRLAAAGRQSADPCWRATASADTPLVCAGVIGFADAVRLVELRGKFMQEAVPEGTGAMSAIIGMMTLLSPKPVKNRPKGRLSLR